MHLFSVSGTVWQAETGVKVVDDNINAGSALAVAGYDVKVSVGANLWLIDWSLLYI